MGLSITALISGALLVLAFAPFHFWLLGIIAPAILLALCIQHPARTAFYRAFIFGLGFFGAGISWVYVSIHTFGQTSVALAIALTFIFVAFFSLFIASMMATLCALIKTPRYRILAYPFFWALFEIIRSWFLSGFPWLLIAYSQTESPLAGFIPVLGETGVGFLVISLSSLFFSYAIKPFTSDNFSLSTLRAHYVRFSPTPLIIACIFILGISLSHIEWTKPDKTLKISMVQGNIPQSLKWDPLALTHHLQRYWQLSQNLWHNDLVIWPENGIPAFPIHVAPHLELIQDTAKTSGSTLLTGIPLSNVNGSYNNGLIALGLHEGRYLKRHLVPFGEYVPLASLLRGLIHLFDLPMSDFEVGPLSQSLIRVKDIPINILICYEIAFEDLLRQDLPEAKLLVTISDDAWFGDSLAPSQHLQIAQFRALQSQRPVLFATNNGITAIINANGRIQRQLKPFIADVLSGQIITRAGTPPWLWINPWLELLFIVASLLTIVYLDRKLGAIYNHPNENNSQ